MKKVFRILLWTIIGLLFVSTFVYLYLNSQDKKDSYQTVKPSIATIERSTVLTGKIEPRDEIDIKPQISGIITEIEVEAGDRVKAGDVIARIKVIPEASQLSSAQSRVNLAKIELRDAKVKFDRDADLYAKKVISREDYETSEKTYKRAQEELESAEDAFRIVREGVSQYNAKESNTLVRATINGLVLDVPVKVGSSVIQSNTFNDGTTIATVADMTNMQFQGKVDETDVGKLRSGMPVRLTIGALQDVELDAELEYVAPKATEDNGVIMFEVKAAVSIPEGIFVRAGYSANASVMIENREGVLTLPESTVEFDDGKSYVQVLTSPEGSEEQTFERREVGVGLSDGIDMEITEGVGENDRVRGAKQAVKEK